MLTYGSNAVRADATQSFWNGYFNIADTFEGLVYAKDSTQATETFAWFGNAPMPQEWVGDRQYKSVPAQTQSVANKHYESSVEVDKALIQFDQVEAVSNLSGSLGVKAGALESDLTTALMVAGVSDSIGTCYDGQYFYDTDHADPNGATYTTSQSNDLTSTDGIDEVGLRAGIESAINAIVGFKDNEGDPWHIIDFSPSNWVVHVPPSLHTSAMKVFTNDTIYSGTETYTNNLKGMFTPRTNQFLTATDEIYIHYVGAPHKPFIKQMAGGLVLDDEKDLDTGHYKYCTSQWMRVFYGDWRTSCFVKLS